VVLPTSSASLAPGQGSAAPLVIAVDRGAASSISKASPSEPRLCTSACAAKPGPTPSARCGWTATAAAAYQHIVHVLDLCQLAGLTHIAMHTRK
jgi:biopolymer transport protein ExbD